MNDRWLPTRPATQIEWQAAHRWSACRWCRMLACLHLWKIRDRHMDRHHPAPKLTYLEDQ